MLLQPILQKIIQTQGYILVVRSDDGELHAKMFDNLNTLLLDTSLHKEVAAIIEYKLGNTRQLDHDFLLDMARNRMPEAAE